MADGGNVVEGEVDEDEPATMSYPLITVSDLPSSTTAGISTLLPLQLIIILIIFLCFTFTPFILNCTNYTKASDARSLFSGTSN